MATASDAVALVCVTDAVKAANHATLRTKEAVDGLQPAERGWCSDACTCQNTLLPRHFERLKQALACVAAKISERARKHRECLAHFSADPLEHSPASTAMVLHAYAMHATEHADSIRDRLGSICGVLEQIVADARADRDFFTKAGLAADAEAAVAQAAAAKARCPALVVKFAVAGALAAVGLWRSAPAIGFRGIVLSASVVAAVVGAVAGMLLGVFAARYVFSHPLSAADCGAVRAQGASRGPKSASEKRIRHAHALLMQARAAARMHSDLVHVLNGLRGAHEQRPIDTASGRDGAAEQQSLQPGQCPAIAQDLAAALQCIDERFPPPKEEPRRWRRVTSKLLRRRIVQPSTTT
jgi:hypothetical protein